MTMTIVKADSKYTFEVSDDGTVCIYRGGELWVWEIGAGAKAIIALVHRTKHLESCLRSIAGSSTADPEAAQFATRAVENPPTAITLDVVSTHPTHDSGKGEAMSYEEKVVVCFRELCSENTEGTSPAEVTERMAEKGWLSEMDTVIDIADIMQRLRSEGRL
jgi:hypothetical protein